MIGFLVRLLFVYIGIYIDQNDHIQMKYTDIDYDVVSDAAEWVFLSMNLCY